MPSVLFPTAGGELPGHLARPAGSGPWPGIVVLFDAVGLSDDTRRQADRFAAEGYLALAPDFYARGGGRLRCIAAAFRQLGARRGPFFEQIEAARAWLADRPGR